MKYTLLFLPMILLASCQLSTPAPTGSDSSATSSGQSTNTSPTLAPEKLDSGLAPTPSGMSR